MNEKSKILVTGGTGFLGEHLVKELKEKGYKNITVFSNRIEDKLNGVNYIKGDIRNKDEVENAVEGKDIVYHLAAILSESAPSDLIYEVNVDGTRNVAEACQEKEVEKLIHVSSVGVMGPTPEGETADESYPYNPQTTYEKSKRDAEEIIKDLIKVEDLNALILRLGMVYGPNHYWKKIIKKAKEGFPLIGQADNRWHLLYVENAVHGLIQAGKRGSLGETYIIADKEIKTYKEAYKLICELSEVEKPEKKVPVWLANLIAFFYEIKSKIKGSSPIVSREHIKRLTRERRYSTKKAEKELNYRPPYTLKEGMKKTISEIGDQN